MKARVQKLEFISDYKHIEKYRKSFNKLANITFGIDFEKWYNLGFWNERYTCYSYLYNDKVIANVSTNSINLLINNHIYNGILIGTVMTHPDYRGSGYSKKLMNQVLEKHNKEFSFLFANKSALNFYPKFGFESKKEVFFIYNNITENNVNNKLKKIRKINIEDQNDFRNLQKIIFNHKPLSNIFSVLNGETILMWNCLYVFYNDLYFIDNENIVIIFKQENDCLNIFDVISEKEIDLDDVITSIKPNNISKVNLYFTPPEINKKFSIGEINSNDDLFYKSTADFFPQDFKYPITVQG